MMHSMSRAYGNKLCTNLFVPGKYKVGHLRIWYWARVKTIEKTKFRVNGLESYSGKEHVRIQAGQ